MVNFSHSHVHSASLHYPVSIMAIDPVYPQASLPMRVTLFPSGMLCATNIPSINGNDALFCSQLNGEHAGGNVRSLRLIVVFLYANVKLKNLSILRKFVL